MEPQVHGVACGLASNVVANMDAQKAEAGLCAASG